MSKAVQILQFSKKGKDTITINLEVQTEILEDGSIWMRAKLNIDRGWGEWRRIALG